MRTFSGRKGKYYARTFNEQKWYFVEHSVIEKVCVIHLLSRNGIFKTLSRKGYFMTTFNDRNGIC